jgi:hypothetical protein
MSLPRFLPWINGAFVAAPDSEFDTVLNPFTGEPAAEVVRSTAADLERAIAAAQSGFQLMRALPRHARRDLLTRIAAALQSRRAELGAAVAVSCGKPITQALAEVDRAIITFSLAADEARRFGGEVIPLDVDSRAAWTGWWSGFRWDRSVPFPRSIFRSICWSTKWRRRSRWAAPWWSSRRRSVPSWPICWGR